MIYIVSGSSRSGKTITAKKINLEKGISYLSLDWIVMGFTNGIPEYGVHDKLFPDEIARGTWTFIKAMIESMLYNETECVIEGEAILPELISELINKYPQKIRIVFLGYTDISVKQKVKEIKIYSQDKNDWLLEHPDNYIIDHVINMVVHSQMIKESCTYYDLPYFDTSADFMSSIDQAISHLLLE